MVGDSEASTFMSENVSIHIPKTGVAKIIAKIIVALSIGLLMGHHLGTKKMAQFTYAQQLTREQYVLNYEHYRDSLMTNSHSIEYHTLTSAIGMLILIAGYEILATGLGWIITKTCPQKPNEVA